MVQEQDPEHPTEGREDQRHWQLGSAADEHLGEQGQHAALEFLLLGCFSVIEGEL